MSTGKFVWHELMTKEPEAALKFYGELFGWKFKTGEMGPMKYHEIMVGERQIGGITGTMGPDQPSAWHAYVTVDNVDAAVQRAQRNGGKVHMPAMDIPQTGRFAMLADPSGAVLAPFTYAGEMPEKSGTPETPEPGTFVWNELMTDDIQAAQRYYSEVFGWTARAQDMGPMGTYHLFQREGKDVAGMMTRPKEMPVSFWMHYAGVADVNATHAKAQKLGAKPVKPPTDIPGIGRFSVLSDPAGAVISLFMGAAK